MQNFMGQLLNAMARYNAMAEADDTRTWGHLPVKAWVGIAERLETEVILSGIGGQNFHFARGRINDAWKRAGEPHRYRTASWLGRDATS